MKKRKLMRLLLAVGVTFAALGTEAEAAIESPVEKALASAVAVTSVEMAADAALTQQHSAGKGQTGSIYAYDESDITLKGTESITFDGASQGFSDGSHVRADGKITFAAPIIKIKLPTEIAGGEIAGLDADKTSIAAAAYGAQAAAAASACSTGSRTGTRSTAWAGRPARATTGPRRLLHSTSIRSSRICRTVRIDGITIKGGKATVGIEQQGNGDNWGSIDNVKFYRKS